MLMLQFILTVPVNATNKRKIPKLDTLKGSTKSCVLFFSNLIVQAALALPQMRVRYGELHAQE